MVWRCKYTSFTVGGVSDRAYANKKKDKKDEEEVENDTPKKRKRIKLDPYDVLNKRMDDGVSMDVVGWRRLIELRRAGYNVGLSAFLDNIPHSTSSEREHCEENLTLLGRSNVGNSSLLNALTRQWGVARTSDKPGLTQTINFFNLGSKMCLVDLPGYGFAYAKDEVKDAWEELVKEYVSTRVGLNRVCLMIDTKWGMKPRDHELVHLMEGKMSGSTPTKYVKGGCLQSTPSPKCMKTIFTKMEDKFDTLRVEVNELMK
ncbi:hypothetical protein Syun_006465 [Stephania yunnanensis]|uniref:EngB-type G domain-containing protein n=1 Tax=Stephania yunnanensis TaxID=152371 RepID=A0AAP0L019_9MAGN